MITFILILKVINKVLGLILPILLLLALLAFGALQVYVWLIYKVPEDGMVPLWIEFCKFNWNMLVPASKSLF